jgi:hypothetical protein
VGNYGERYATSQCIAQQWPLWYRPGRSISALSAPRRPHSGHQDSS